MITATFMEGSIILTADSQRRIRIWTARPMRTSTGSRNACLGQLQAAHEVNVLQYEGGKWIGSAGEDGCICLWMLMEERDGVVDDIYCHQSISRYDHPGTCHTNYLLPTKISLDGYRIH